VSTDCDKKCVHDIATSTLGFSDRIGEKFSPLLSGMSVKRVQHLPDLRWGLYFYDAQGKEAGSLFVDQFGQYGYLNDQNVSFESRHGLLNVAKQLHKISAIGD